MNWFHLVFGLEFFIPNQIYQQEKSGHQGCQKITKYVNACYIIKIISTVLKSSNACKCVKILIYLCYANKLKTVITKLISIFINIPGSEADAVKTWRRKKSMESLAAMVLSCGRNMWWMLVTQCSPPRWTTQPLQAQPTTTIKQGLSCPSLTF